MRIFGHVQTPLPPCTHLYALVLTPPPTPLGAYVINGRPPMVFLSINLLISVSREGCNTTWAFPVHCTL